MGKLIRSDEDIWSDKSLTPKQIMSAVKLLRNNLKMSGKNMLLQDSSSKSLYLVISLYKIPIIPKSGEQKPATIKIPVPNNFHSGKEILLITQDTKKVKLKGDWDKSIVRYTNLLKDHKARDLVSEVMPLHQLRMEYKDYEAKRNLSNKFDFVLCDDTIINRVPMFLGKAFYSKKKKPVAVNLKAENLKAELNQVLHRAYLNMNLKGNTAMVEIGNLDLSNKGIADNLWAASKHLAKKIPGKIKNIQSLYIKTESSKSVPLYLNLNPRSDVGTVEHPTKPTKNTFVLDELPTGRFVKVYRDGTVDQLPETFKPNKNLLVKGKGNIKARRRRNKSERKNENSLKN